MLYYCQHAANKHWTIQDGTTHNKDERRVSKERFLTARSSDEGGGDGGGGDDDGGNVDGFVAVALSPNPSTRSLRLNEFLKRNEAQWREKVCCIQM